MTCKLPFAWDTEVPEKDQLLVSLGKSGMADNLLFQSRRVEQEVLDILEEPFPLAPEAMTSTCASIARKP
jgi:hypothetical protein